MENAIVIYTFKTIIQKADVKKMTRSQSGNKEEVQSHNQNYAKGSTGEDHKGWDVKKDVSSILDKGYCPPQRKK